MTEARADIHPRNWLLFFAGVLCLTRGLGYTFADQVKNGLPYGLATLGAFVPIWLYGATWLLATAAIVWIAVRRRQSYFAFSVAAFPAFIWMLAYAVGWLHVHDKLWIAIFAYQAIAGWIFWSCMVRPKGGWRG